MWNIDDVWEAFTSLQDTSSCNDICMSQPNCVNCKPLRNKQESVSQRLKQVSRFFEKLCISRDHYIQFPESVALEKWLQLDLDFLGVK